MNQTSLSIYRRFRQKTAKGAVYHGNALEFLRRLPPNSAQIVFLDPPFNLGKAYGTRSGKHDSLDESDYEFWMREILKNSIRVLQDGGSLYLYHIPKWAQRFCGILDGVLSFRHWIAIAMKNGFKRGGGLYPAHYALLLFTKGDFKPLNVPVVSPQICSSCGDYARDYGGYRQIIDDKGGVNLSDFWDDLSPVRHKKHKNRQANELPIRLYERVIAISGQQGTVFCDPFAGTGSSLVTAVQYGMEFRGCDIVKTNCRLISERLDSIQKDSNVKEKK